MKKITFFGLIMLFSLFCFSVKAETNFNLTTVAGEVTLDYDAVSAERAKAQADRWITVVNFGASGTSGKCGSAAKTFDIKLGRTIEFFLEKCDKMIIYANIAVSRGLVVNIDGGSNINLDGTGICKDYEVLVNKEVPVKIKVQGLTSSSAWTSFFTFSYAAKVPSISAFKINGKSAIVDNAAHTISLELPYGTDISSVTPEVTLGGTALSYSPTAAQDFSTGSKNFTITDGVTPVDYTATITVKATPDTEKSISTLTVNGKAATIDEASGSITCDFPSFAGPLASWPVAFVLNSETASVDFNSGSNFDFTTQSSLTITVTAQDNSTKVYTVSPTISTKKNIGLLTLDGKAAAYDNLLLSAFDNYYVNFIMANASAPADINSFYQNYDLLVLHPNVGGTNATAVATKAMVGVKPVLNLKVFFYSSGRWAWSTVSPASSAAGVGSSDVDLSLQSHPIFNNVAFSGNSLSFYDNLPATNVNALQYANDIATITAGLNSHTIATMNTTGIQMHEIQDNLAAKYLLVGLSIENNNFNYLNNNAINVLKNSAAYLLDSSAQFTFPTTGLVTNTNDKSSIYYNNDLIYNPNQLSIVIYNAAGLKVKSSNNKTINTKYLSKGVYMVRSNDVKVVKFIK